MGEKKDAYRVLVGKPGEIPLGRRWDILEQLGNWWLFMKDSAPWS
jgi:hypothetical protein